MKKFIKRKLQQFILFLIKDYKNEVEENSKIIIEDLNAKIDYLNNELAKSNSIIIDNINNLDKSVVKLVDYNCNKLSFQIEKEISKLEYKLDEVNCDLTDRVNIVKDDLSELDDNFDNYVFKTVGDTIDYKLYVDGELVKLEELIDCNKSDIENNLIITEKQFNNKLECNVKSLVSIINNNDLELQNEIVLLSQDIRDNINTLKSNLSEEVESLNIDIEDLNKDVDGIDLELELMQERYIPTYGVNNYVLDKDAKEYSKSYDIMNNTLCERVLVNGTWCQSSGIVKEIQSVENKISIDNFDGELNHDLVFGQGKGIIIKDKYNCDYKYKIIVESGYLIAEKIVE